MLEIPQAKNTQSNPSHIKSDIYRIRFKVNDFIGWSEWGLSTNLQDDMHDIQELHNGTDKVQFEIQHLKQNGEWE